MQFKERRSITKRKEVLIATVITGAVIVVLGFVKFFQISAAIAKNANFQLPPTAVTTISAERSMWPNTLSAVATLEASQGATLSAEEGGEVASILFESGAAVEAGTVLVELDSEVEQAELRGAEATLIEAEAGLERARTLKAKGAQSQAELDLALAKEREAKAQVESLKATIERMKIIAPFSGRTGIRMVNIGQYLSPGTPVVPLYSLDPLYVNFTVPQQAISKLSIGLSVKVTVDAFKGEDFEAKLTTIDPRVDPQTRNVNLQATLRNPEEKLRPGMFADVTLILPGGEELISIPASSINYAPYGNTVFIVEKMKGQEGNEYLGVRQQVVELGAKRGNQVAVLTGVNPGEEVVTSGTFRLRPAAPVIVNNTGSPSNDPAPQPADT